MALPCIRCGNTLTGGRFCPECGAEQQGHSRESDPCVGRTIGDRYEIGELIGVGGMGRIHRGHQRSLDRPVAIKFIHPHLMSSEAAATRFMMEARAASRLAHPNVVSIFDFGRTSPDEGGELFLVMELLSGSNLAKVLEREGPLPHRRIVEILRQTLLALSEAHRRGVTHRDIKPDNIFIERHYGDGDHVKVIDFGLASVSGHDTSQPGQILGTPGYMAPEQVMGEESGPAADLYSVGVILFEMLTGRLPFEGSTATVCFNHTSAPRPNPRIVALDTDIPHDLALACMRAMAIDPANRHRDAETFADELVRAITPHSGAPERPPAARISYPPPGAELEPFSTRHAMADTMPSIIPPPPQGARTLSLRPLAARIDERDAMPFVGRDDIVSRCEELFNDPGGLAGIVLWGRPGVGKTRLVHELTPAMARRGSVHKVLAAPPPLSEVGYSGLRRIIMELTGIPSGDRLLSIGQAKHGSVLPGLRAIFGSPLSPDTENGSRRIVLPDATRALTWAVSWAIERSGGAKVFLVLDDIDAMDGGSLAAMDELLRGAPIPGFFVVATADRRPATRTGDRIEHREIRGILRVSAMVVLGHILEPRELDPANDDIEPLFLEHWSAWRAESREPPPGSLNELIAERIGRLPREEILALQILAVTGGGALSSLSSLTAMVQSSGELEACIGRLSQAGFAWTQGGTTALSHALFGRIALALGPEETITALHATAAEAVKSSRDLVELRAYHAFRGGGGLDAFLLLEEAANLRMMRGDVDGATAALESAVRAARALAARGEDDTAGSARSIFGRKLSAALLSAGRIDEAHGVLEETLAAAGERATSRALVLEQLAIVAQHRGQVELAQRLWNDALSIAELRADYALLQRFRRPIPALPTGEQPRLFRPRHAALK